MDILKLFRLFILLFIFLLCTFLFRLAVFAILLVSRRLILHLGLIVNIVADGRADEWAAAAQALAEADKGLQDDQVHQCDMVVSIAPPLEVPPVVAIIS